jgi:O-succinylbenzoic acid--CoA ligase
MTETGSGIVYDGLPLDGVEVRIDRDGEVLVRGPMLLRCYRDGTDPRDADGWLHTGDVGSWRDDGRLHVDGRRGDLIITGGENVWPDAVERVLTDHPGIDEVAVAGVDDTEWGQRVVAWVVPADPARPPSLGDVRAWARERMPAFLAPREMVVVDTLPRTALGKVPRRSLTGRGDRG